MVTTTKKKKKRKPYTTKQWIEGVVFALLCLLLVLGTVARFYHYAHKHL